MSFSFVITLIACAPASDTLVRKPASTSETTSEPAPPLPPPSVSGQPWISPTLGTMKWIPAGTFLMGSPASEVGRFGDEKQHQVTLTKGFWMMEHEVTQGEWQAVMGSNPAMPATRPREQYGSRAGEPRHRAGPEGWCARRGNEAAAAASQPVYCVYIKEVEEFARRVSARDGVAYALPTEAQWEYAARGGGTGVYAGGNELDAVGWYREISGNQTHPACQKARNGFGLCDMSGNVSEVTATLYWDYPASAVTDPTGPASSKSRVVRGGDWEKRADGARAAARGTVTEERTLDPVASDSFGFRLLRMNY